ncbi:Uncharacterised protein [Vibrio cholerae]|nr:Uncharacterised protein [Vibrio cholerae]
MMGRWLLFQLLTPTTTNTALIFSITGKVRSLTVSARFGRGNNWSLVTVTLLLPPLGLPSRYPLIHSKVNCGQGAAISHWYSKRF